MRPIGLVVLAVVMTCASGCDTVPRAAELDNRDVQKIAWTKGQHAQAFRDQHGVCQLFTQDTKTALPALGEQVKACFDGSLPRMPIKAAEAKSIKVVWNKVPRDQLNALYADTLSQNAILLTSTRRRSPAPLMSVRGFYTYVADTCHVVVPDDSNTAGTLGHEFKHCVDGLFHNEHGEWLQGDPI